MWTSKDVDEQRVDQQRCGSAKMWISKDMDYERCGSAKSGSAKIWISKDVDQQRYGLRTINTVLQEWLMLLRFLWIGGARWPETLGIQPVGTFVHLKPCQLFKRRSLRDRCGNVDMWICGSAKMTMITTT
ncbi:predicted protein [Lichtheimia corymbifera JMRC:FSU:9682]|uniref:Uncharacterized protein n=1 Tax=Lichtheimia corymbifera JMRC:FSU:9682 TaxID=1263082 RepID=A0A068SIY8_9FUNG|nr:predicted protein [Lichtheimia corymbifera JMRC:FSU:9682]